MLKMYSHHHHHHEGHREPPTDPLQPLRDVCLPGIQTYDGDDFAGYPLRQGWGPRTPSEWYRLFTEPDADFVHFLERWSILGPLFVASQQVGDTSLSMSDLVEVAADKSSSSSSFSTLLNVDNVLRLLRRVSSLWEEHYRGFELDDQVRDIKDCVRLGAAVLCGGNAPTAYLIPKVAHSYTTPYTLREFLLDWLVTDPRRPGVPTATCTLLELLWSRIHSGSDIDAPWLTMLGKTSLPCRNPDDELWNLFTLEGWCPALLRHIQRTLDTCSLSFVYNLLRTRSRELGQTNDRHPRPVEQPEYSNEEFCQLMEKGPPYPWDVPVDPFCTAEKCIHDNLNDATYRSRHTEDCIDQCSFVEADQAKLVRLLEGGSIPLIESIGEQDHAQEITLVETPPNSWVAISHVWSDGLGNVQRNTIPLCQLRRLSRLTRRLFGEQHSGPALFWLDTICVPPDAAGVPHAQQLALANMRRVYAEAKAVLVLDSWLFTDSVLGRPDAETFMQILCCPWNYRLWTYQEGAVAEVLLFQFKDGAFNIDEGIERLRKCPDDAVRLTLLPVLTRLHYNMRGFRGFGLTGDRISAMVESLSMRTTSVSSDESLCLGALFDLKVDQIAQADPGDRMGTMWTMLQAKMAEMTNLKWGYAPGLDHREIPRGLLFNPYGPTLSTYGFRWAPSSFLGLTPADIRFSGTPGDGSDLLLTQHGLALKASATIVYALPEDFNPDAKLFVRDEQTGTWISFVPRADPDSLQRARISELSTLAIIENVDWRGLFRDPEYQRSWEKPEKTAIVVRVDETDIHLADMKNSIVRGSGFESPSETHSFCRCSFLFRATLDDEHIIDAVTNAYEHSRIPQEKWTMVNSLEGGLFMAALGQTMGSDTRWLIT